MLGVCSDTSFQNCSLIAHAGDLTKTGSGGGRGAGGASGDGRIRERGLIFAVESRG